MKRTHFLATAGVISAALGSAAVASGAGFPYPVSAGAAGPTAAPSPLPSTLRRGEHRSFADLRHAYRAIERIIDRLQRDQTDFGGHRAAAIADLQRARADIAAALQFDRTHPNSTVNPSIPTTNQLNSNPFSN